MAEERKEIELQSHRAMIEIPENALEIEMICKVYEEGRIIEVKRTLDMSDIREACRKADEGYIDDDDRFELTDKGRAWLEELMKDG